MLSSNLISASYIQVFLEEKPIGDSECGFLFEIIADLKRQK